LVCSNYYHLDGIYFAEVSLSPDHVSDQFLKLPPVIVIDGIDLGKSCYNSDRFIAIYRSDLIIAKIK